MLDWLNGHGQLITLLSILFSLAGFALGIAVMVNLPADFFLQKVPLAASVDRRHVLFRLFLGIVKNCLGALMMVLGLAMALPLVPGPGVVLLLFGLSLMNFPGKKKLELRLLKFPGALTAVNAIRRRFKRPPFELPQE